jgi:hypothetical protein
MALLDKQRADLLLKKMRSVIVCGQALRPKTGEARHDSDPASNAKKTMPEVGQPASKSGQERAYHSETSPRSVDQALKKLTCRSTNRILAATQ